MRYLRYDIGITLLAAAVFCIVGITGMQEPGLIASALPVTWWFLIGRLIHAEALPGNRQFWLTRPYRWTSLLAAKALFILCFVHLPLLLADALIIHAAGFSLAEQWAGLFWSQVLLIAVFALPVALLSAITNGLPELLAVVLFVVLVVLVRVLVSPLLHHDFAWWELEWVKTYFLITLAALASALILVWQYARRKTLAMRLLTGALAIGLLAASTLLPWTTAFRLQTRLSSRQVDLSSVRIELDSDRKWLGRAYPTEEGWTVAELPVQISGLPDGAELKPHGFKISLRASDGEIHIADQPPPSSFSVEGGIISLRFMLEKALYEQVKDRPLQLRGTLYATLYGNKQQTPLSLNGRPVTVKGVGLCSAGTHFLLCRSAFRMPSDLVLIHILQDSPIGMRATVESFPRVASYSPFPAGLGIDPLVTSSLPFGNKIFEASIETAEPFTHFERNFEINQVRLSEYAPNSRLTAMQQ